MAKETDTSRKFDEDAALKAIVQGTASGTGEAFFSSLVENLAVVLGVHGAWVTELEAEACRLNVFPIEIPALRERGNDVVLIAEKFVENLCLKMGRPAVELAEGVKQSILAQQWPGNVRELQNVLARPR